MSFNKVSVLLGDDEGPDSGMMEVDCPDGFYVSGAVIYLENGKGGFLRRQFRVDPDGTVVKMEG
jgi:hypothetical protein